jgi:hypothetical protein
MTAQDPRFESADYDDSLSNGTEAMPNDAGQAGDALQKAQAEAAEMKDAWLRARAGR